MKIEIQNLEQLQREMENVNLKVLDAVHDAVTDLTTDVMKQSMDLVPFDTGNLRRSIVVKYTKLRSQQPEGEISYGGAAAPYAVVQHENEKLFHPSKARGGTGPTQPPTQGSPKYLEYPVKQIAGKKFEKTILEKVNKFLR